VHESNDRNLSVQLSLSQLAKTLCLSYYCLCLLFNKIGEKVVPGIEGRWRERKGGRHGGEMAQTTYAHVNK
jgi:hypothetical protein